MKKDVSNHNVEKYSNRYSIPSLYKQYREGMLYLFFGGLAFLLNVFLFTVFINIKIDELIANIIAWIITVLFAYITNTIWVFSAKTKLMKQLLIQIFQFFSGRVVTLIIEEVMLLVFITILGINAMLIKFIAQIVVIVGNYIISKIWVYRK